MRQYLDILLNTVSKGIDMPYRNGVRRTVFNSSFCHQLSSDNGAITNFPLLTTKKMSLKTIAYELHGFITNDDDFIRENTKIWQQWEGKIPYGEFWSEQLPNVMDKAKSCLDNGKTDTRLLVTASPDMLINSKYALPPCHCSFMLHPVHGNLGLTFSMRSSDVPIGLPYNLASYALLLAWICKQLDCLPVFVGYHAHNAHIYANQVDLAIEQIARTPKKLPAVRLIGDSVLDFELSNYEYHPPINYPVSA